jgi:hypothetical protein
VTVWIDTNPHLPRCLGGPTDLKKMLGENRRILGFPTLVTDLQSFCSCIFLSEVHPFVAASRCGIALSPTGRNPLGQDFKKKARARLVLRRMHSCVRAHGLREQRAALDGLCFLLAGLRKPRSTDTSSVLAMVGSVRSSLRFSFTSSDARRCILTALGPLLVSACQQPDEGQPSPDQVESAECGGKAMLSDIRDSSGALVDVRIFQLGRTRLYVPTEWIAKGLFVDHVPGNVSKLASGRFTPDIRTTDCPGVIYSPTEQGEETNSLLPKISVRLDGREKPRQINSPTIKALFLSKNTRREDDPRMNAARSGGFYTTYFIASDDVFVFLADAQKYPLGGVESQSLAEFVEWLATPPAKRENGKIFNLEIDTGAIND